MEQRVLLWVVKELQVHFRGRLLRDNLRKWEDLPTCYRVSVQMSDVLQGSRHYEDVLVAVRSLCGKVIEWREPRAESWHSTSIIYEARHEKGSGVVSFYVSVSLLELILDFSFGFSKFSLENIFRLRSPYAMRLYALMSSQRRPVTLRVESLYGMFDLSGKYAQVSDFEKKVLRPARKSLDDLKMNSFSYAANKPGRKILSYTFFPIHREFDDKKKLLAQLPVSAVCHAQLKKVLLDEFGFSSRELGSHKELLDEFSKLPSWESSLSDILHRFRKGAKGKGWVIAALRGEVDNS